MGLGLESTCAKMRPRGARGRRSERAGNPGCPEALQIHQSDHSLRNTSLGCELFELLQFNFTVYLEMNSLVIGPM